MLAARQPCLLVTDISEKTFNDGNVRVRWLAILRQFTIGWHIMVFARAIVRLL